MGSWTVLVRWGAKDKCGTFWGQKWQIIYQGGGERQLRIVPGSVSGASWWVVVTLTRKRRVGRRGLVPEADLVWQVWGI